MGSMLVSKGRARLPLLLQKTVLNHKKEKKIKKKKEIKKKKKEKGKKKEIELMHKCSEGRQHINPYVDGLKSKSEHSVAPVTGSHISYEL